MEDTDGFTMVVSRRTRIQNEKTAKRKKEELRRKLEEAKLPRSTAVSTRFSNLKLI
jgi:hypothetical protein